MPTPPELSDDAVERIDDGDTVWRVERDFLRSNWTCIWGRGCLGILDEPAEELNQGCCSVGAEFGDTDEAMLISALRRHARAGALPVPRRRRRTVASSTTPAPTPGSSTARASSSTGPGSRAAPAARCTSPPSTPASPPIDWKPSVCWQLPVRVDWVDLGDGREQATVRRWSRADWGDEGETMAWCCTEGDRAYVGDRPVVESLADRARGDRRHHGLRRAPSPPGLSPCGPSIPGPAACFGSFARRRRTMFDVLDGAEGAENMGVVVPDQIPMVEYLVLGDEPHLEANECTACGARFFDRRNACASCSGREFTKAAIATEGEVRAFTIVTPWMPGTDALRARRSSTAAAPACAANIINTQPDPEHVTLGMKVKLTTFSIGADTTGTEAINYGFEPANQGA